jgi:hypothetical protein
VAISGQLRHKRRNAPYMMRKPDCSVMQKAKGSFYPFDASSPGFEHNK